MGILSRRRTEPAAQPPAEQPPAAPAARPPAYTPEAQRPVSNTPAAQPPAAPAAINTDLPLYINASIAGNETLGVIVREYKPAEYQNMSINDLTRRLMDKSAAKTETEKDICLAFNGLKDSVEEVDRRENGDYVVNIMSGNKTKWFNQPQANQKSLKDILGAPEKQAGADGRLADVNKLVLEYNAPKGGGLQRLYELIFK